MTFYFFLPAYRDIMSKNFIILCLCTYWKISENVSLRASPAPSVVAFSVSHHRLNGSSSPVLTATSLSYGKTKNSTPHRIKTPDLIEIKFGTVDYVGELTPHAKIHVNPSKGGFPTNG